MGRWVWIMGGALAGLYVAYLTLDFAWTSGVFVTVPKDRDPPLVGRWRAVWTGKFPGIAEVVLRPDGTVEGPFFDRARWGTQKGVLRVKTLEEDYWRGLDAAYVAGPDGCSIDLKPRRNYSIPNRMTKPYLASERISEEQGGLPMFEQAERRRHTRLP